MRKCEIPIFIPNHSTLHVSFLPSGEWELAISLSRGPDSRAVRAFSLSSLFKQPCRGIPPSLLSRRGGL